MAASTPEANDYNFSAQPSVVRKKQKYAATDLAQEAIDQE
jgi:hypothetical protein